MVLGYVSSSNRLTEDLDNNGNIPNFLLTVNGIHCVDRERRMRRCEKDAVIDGNHSHQRRRTLRRFRRWRSNRSLTATDGQGHPTRQRQSERIKSDSDSDSDSSNSNSSASGHKSSGGGGGIGNGCKPLV
jgi:uncharacterized membrane protein YgcG